MNLPQARKPRLTKHKRGWKCSFDWQRVVEPTMQLAYARWEELNRTFWSTKTPKPDCLDCENAICDECDPNRPYAAVVCLGHGIEAIPACGKVDLTRAEYDEQMRYPDRGWRCPRCKADAWFDDERFEKLHGVGQ